MESPSPVAIQTLNLGFASLMPVAMAAARPCSPWNP